MKATSSSGANSPLGAAQLVTRNTPGEWAAGFLPCLGFALFMWAYHDWWRAKPYTLGTANEALALAALLGLSLAVAAGPCCRLTGAGQRFVRVRRPLGISAAILAAAHVLVTLLGCGDKFGVAYFTGHLVSFVAGLAAALALLWLALISTPGWVKRLGYKRWGQFQWAGFLVLALVLVHYLVLGGPAKWVAWFEKFDKPAPPGTLIGTAIAALALLLKGLDALRAWTHKRVASGSPARA